MQNSKKRTAPGFDWKWYEKRDFVSKVRLLCFVLVLVFASQRLNHFFLSIPSFALSSWTSSQQLLSFSENSNDMNATIQQQMPEPVPPQPKRCPASSAPRYPTHGLYAKRRQRASIRIVRHMRVPFSHHDDTTRMINYLCR